MNTSTRVFVMLIWLGGLAIAGSVVLALTASRVGEHRSSTYGYAYVQFQDSWGGEIGIIPPEFALERKYTESIYNKDSEQYDQVEKTERFTLIPKSINIDSNILYGEQERDLLIFNAFEVENTEDLCPYEYHRLFGRIVRQRNQAGEREFVVRLHHLDSVTERTCHPPGHGKVSDPFTCDGKRGSG